jgi:D-arabinose 1-dehydrogenase-like Zn-dependent alcohol dehydrogenase
MAHGTAKDSEDTLRFSAMSGALPMVETYPLERVNEDFDHMITNRARFRVVLTMAGSGD